MADGTFTSTLNHRLSPSDSDVQHTTHVGQDVRDLTALVSLTRPTDELVEDEINQQTGALKVQSIAAVILAVIQSQALAASSDLTDVKSSVATSAFFSVGILLDVIGALYALTSAYQLEANLFSVKSFIRGLDDKELDEITHLRLSPLAKKLARQNSLHPIEKRMVVEEDGGISGDKLYRKTSLERYSRSIQMNRSAGHLASAAIALGFITFPIGFLCLLQGTQPLAVQISAYTVVGILLFVRFLVIPLQTVIGRRII